MSSGVKGLQSVMLLCRTSLYRSRRLAVLEITEVAIPSPSLNAILNILNSALLCPKFTRLRDYGDVALDAVQSST